jgi:hypothetical protein
MHVTYDQDTCLCTKVFPQHDCIVRKLYECPSVKEETNKSWAINTVEYNKRE